MVFVSSTDFGILANRSTDWESTKMSFEEARAMG
jgi:hypothetical protein